MTATDHSSNTIDTPEQPARPEQQARGVIDDNLRAAGWQVQSADSMDISAAFGVAVAEVPISRRVGTPDYTLYVDREKVGIVEAKAHGALSGAEAQSARYASDADRREVRDARPQPELRYRFESNGHKTYFTDGGDPVPRSREVFNFPRPQTLAELSAQPAATLRSRLQRLPALDESRLWAVQGRAISALEASFARADERALIQMATGAGKTFTAVNVVYRLLKHAGAKRVLFLVDRNNLGRQARDEFANFAPPDDARKFPELYAVQRLDANVVNPAAKVVITTIQRLFSMLKGEIEYDAGNEDDSAFDAAPWRGEPPEVVYNAAIPPEFFDFIVIDECHRSIYDLWSQVLLYFDAFLIGLTATPAGKTLGFFNQNLVMQYGHDAAVADGVNVDFDVYRINTRVTEEGATIAAEPGAVYVAQRDKLTRQERLERLTDDLTYTANQVDRDVVAVSQIRTVLREFRNAVLPAAFPDREEVPKTLVFAKDDSHAEDIVRLAREEFGQGNEFCQKITYRTGFTKVPTTVKGEDGAERESFEWRKTADMTPEELLASFRNSYHPRIAVTVDMISTGTDVKPIECVFFLRNVKSAGFFEQMKGRGVRVISPDKLRTVTPSAKAKDRFVIVDAVGVCEQDKTDSQTLNRQPSKSLKQVLDYIAQGGLDPEALTTLAGRLARLQRRLATPELAELRELAGGETLTALAHGLLQAGDADAQAAAAKAQFDVAEPSETQIEAATRQLARDAVTPFLKPALRRRILEMQRQSEQTVDRHTIDEVLYSGFDAAALEKARAKVTDFQAWLQDHKDQIAAIQAIYAGTRPLKLTLADLRQLRRAIAGPPLAATPTQLWRAFEASAPERVQGQGGEPLADLVHLVRCALLPNFTLVPYRDGLRERYQAWLQERDADNAFTEDQRQWLDRIAEHIANSLAIEPADFESGWFGQQGSLGRAHALFGDELKPLLAELNERLAA